MDNRKGFGGVVGKLLLHDEGGRDLVALIEVLVGDEAVHLGPQRDRLDQSRDDEMEHRVGKFRLGFVFLFEVGVDIREINRLGNVRLVVAAVRIDQRRDEVHAVEITQQHAVLPVAPATFLLLHFINHTPYLAEIRRDRVQRRGNIIAKSSEKCKYSGRFWRDRSKLTPL